MPRPESRAEPSSSEVDRIVGAIRGALRIPTGPVALHEPTLGGGEWSYVRECLDAGEVAACGRFVTRFEEELAACTGATHVVATASGTAALHVGLLLAGVGPGEEVLVPGLSFVATANAVRYCGAVPHFVDVEERTLGLDPGRLEEHLSRQTELRRGGCWNRVTGRPVRTVLAVHTLGHPVDLDALAAVCNRFSLALVEDAAAALGSFYRGRHCGTLGRFGVLSFNGNKIVTTGAGGAILTDDGELAQRARHLISTAKRRHPWAYFHDELGFNYRMPNLNAALGCAQLEQLPDFLARKRVLAARYREALGQVAGLRVFDEPPPGRSNHWLSILLLDAERATDRDELLQAGQRDGLELRASWTPLHRLPMYIECPRMNLEVAESLAERIVTLPSSGRLVELDGGG
jgi:perosamine synthetase